MHDTFVQIKQLAELTDGSRFPWIVAAAGEIFWFPLYFLMIYKGYEDKAC